MKHFALLLILLVVLTACRSAKHTEPSVVAAHPLRTEQAEHLVKKEPSYEESRRFNMLFLEAIRQKEADHIDAEFELLGEALKIMPDAPEALYEMAVLRLSYSPYSDTLARREGERLLRRAIALSPDNLYFKETLGTYLTNLANFREAIQIYEDIAEIRPTSETLGNLIWLYKQNGDYPGAIRTIERMEKYDGRSKDLSMEKFQTYIAMHDNEHAYQAIEELCAEYPYDLRYRVLLGDLYDNHGYHEQALDIYRDVLTAEPDNSYAQISLLAYYKAAEADSLYLDLLTRMMLNPRTQSGAKVEAMRSYVADNLQWKADSMPVLSLFDRVLAQPAPSRELAELRVSYMLERKMPEDSLLRALDCVLAIEPDYTPARVLKLPIMIARNDMQAVTQICSEGELYDPSEVFFYYYEGTALFMLGKNQDAIRRLQIGAERVEDDTDTELASDLFALLGDVLHEEKLNEEAYAAYDRALEYNAHNILCLNNYAYFLSLEGHHLDKAEGMSRLTIDAEPDNATYLDTYAWILYCQKDYSSAETYIKRAVELIEDNAGNAGILDHAGDIFYRAGKPGEALTYWKKALRLTTDKAEKKKIQRKVWRRRP